MLSWLLLRPLRWVLLLPVLSLMVVFAFIVAMTFSEHLKSQAYTNGLNAAQARADIVYALLRGRFEYQLLSSQGKEARYQAQLPVIQEETILLLKNLMIDWHGSLSIQDKLTGRFLLWDGQAWHDSLSNSSIKPLSDNPLSTYRTFMPWSWVIEVQADVKTIQSQLWVSRQLLLSLIAGLWLIAVLLVWWQISYLVLKPIAKVINFLADMQPSNQAYIQINTSLDMNLLASQLSQLSARLYQQHGQLSESMRLLKNDRAYIRAVLDAQPAMTLLTNGVEMVDANDALFRFLTEFKTLSDFKQAHSCVCDLFVPYVDPLGYPYFTKNHPNWVNLALVQDCRVLIRNNDQDYHFMVRTRSFSYHEVTYFVAVFDDISEHVITELAMQKQLITDTTTQLPNRIKLLKDMQSSAPQGILLVKILEFGRLNEVYGIQFGDEYLCAFAARLCEECHQLPGLIGPYRLSGSEFAYQLFDDESSAQMWQERAQWLLNDLNQYDLMVWGAQIPVMVSGGFSLWDDEVDDEEQLLLQAAMAINRARKKHLLVLEYDGAWRERQKYQNAQEWLEKVREALVDDRIEPVFQPIYNQVLGHIDKYECLVRIRDHQDQLIAPGLFLDAVRHTREYLHLTQVMFRKSCALFATREEFFTLNLSEDDFRHADHLQTLHDIVERYGVGNRLTLEVLESEEITSYEQMLTALAPFRLLGCSVAVDDFGSGYANFTHISGLEAQVLKIDGSLIQAMAHDISKANVILGLIEFGHHMGLLVVAEFVSSHELWQQLAKMGIDGIQGYAVSPPVRAAMVGTI